MSHVEPAPAPHELEFAGLRTTTATARDYLTLTKPRIIVLLLWTTVTTMVVARPEGLGLPAVLWTCLGGYLAAGGAGAINHYLDRDIDARMPRTQGRPLAAGRIDPAHGLAFGVALGALAAVQLALTVNMLAAALATAGLLGYTLVYTAWLKRRSPQNIVIGGVAGAILPLVGWAAATGELAPEALYPFALVFLWTPPHFWALALLISDDYKRSGVPMLRSSAERARPESRSSPTRWLLLRHPCCRWRPGCSGRCTSRQRSCWERSSSGSPDACAPDRRRAVRGGSSCFRWPTWPCSSRPWPPMRYSCEDRDLEESNERRMQMAGQVTEDAERERFELTVGGSVVGSLSYRARPGLVALLSTEVDDSHEGEGHGSELARCALDSARERDAQVLPFCSFVSEWISRHPDYGDLVPTQFRESFGLAPPAAL